MISQNSPFHCFAKGLTYAKRVFTNLSPENRLDFDDYAETPFISPRHEGVLAVQIIGGDSKVIFRADGESHSDPSSPNFPNRVLLVITDPAIILEREWQFIDLAIESADWASSFPDVHYIARVWCVPYSFKDSEKVFQVNYNLLKTMKPATIPTITFLDNRRDIANNRLETVPNGYIQSVCSTTDVERNIVCGEIKGLARPEFFKEVDVDMWNIENLNESDIPKNIHTIPKIETGIINMNNFVKVWTPNADLSGYPGVRNCACIWRVEKHEVIVSRENNHCTRLTRVKMRLRKPFLVSSRVIDYFPLDVINFIVMQEERITEY